MRKNDMSFCMSEFLHSGAIMSLSKEKLLIGWGEPQLLTSQELNFRSHAPVFYFSDFFLKTPKPWIQYSQWLEISKEDFDDWLGPTTQQSLLPPCDWMIYNPEQFKQSFEELSQLLQSGDLQKAVPYMFIQSLHPMTQERLKGCLKRSLISLNQQAGYLYGYWQKERGVLGITPERLFSHSEQQPRIVQTMALAGTCHPSHDQESFLKSEKEQHEHQLVVQGIYQSLKSLGTIKIGSLQLLQLPHLTHLMTPIEIELNTSFDFATLVRCLHPTPALGAFPIEKGRKWLENYQKHTSRHYYGAPIGFQYFPAGVSQCLVGIRNVQWDHEGMRIGAGCGVVKQSLFDKEWEEIQFKIKAIRDQLHL